MNSRKLLFIAGLSLSSVIGKAQSLSLPYSVDWTDDQYDGWQVFLKADGPAAVSWSFNQSATRGPYEGEWLYGTPINHIDDWMVSPALNLSSSANISFSYRVGNSSSGMTLPGDSAQFYVLTGSADPATATKILLANIDDANESIKKDTSIYIPPANAVSYLAFRYNATADSDFWASIMKVHVTAVPTAVKNMNGPDKRVSIYPNPATGRISWTIPAGAMAEGTTATITDLNGRVVMHVSAEKGYADISTLPPSVYILKMGNQALPFVKQ